MENGSPLFDTYSTIEWRKLLTRFPWVIKKVGYRDGWGEGKLTIAVQLMRTGRGARNKRRKTFFSHIYHQSTAVFFNEIIDRLFLLFTDCELRPWYDGRHSAANCRKKSPGRILVISVWVIQNRQWGGQWWWGLGPCYPWLWWPCSGQA